MRPTSPSPTSCYETDEPIADILAEAQANAEAEAG